MADSLAQLLRRFWNSNEKLTMASMNDMGEVAIESAFAALSFLLRRSAGQEIAPGFVADSFLPESVADLDVQILKGAGLIIDTTAAVPFTEMVFQPLILESNQTLNLDAHSVDPRIDIIYALPAETAFENASVRIWGGASFSNQNLNTASKRSVTLAIQKGTPAATPTRPTVPAGAIEIARCDVPATSGAAVITDLRQRLQLGDPQGLNSDHSVGWVPGSGNELLAAVSLTTNQLDTIEAGYAYASGRRYLIAEQVTNFAIPAADAVQDRYDILCVDPHGNLTVVQGVLGGTRPDAPIGYAGLLSWVMPAAASAPTSVRDERIRYPYTGDMLGDETIEARSLALSSVEAEKIASDAVTAQKIGFDFFCVDIISFGAEDGNHDILVTMRVHQFGDGSAPATGKAHRVRVWATDSVGEALDAAGNDPTFSSAILGNRITGLGRNNAIYETDLNGDLTFIWSGDVSTAGDYYLFAKVVEEGPIMSTTGVFIPSAEVYDVATWA